MTVNLIQYSFTHGEMSPQMIARSDLEIYRKSAKQLRNVVVIPQGGVRRRFGLDYIYDLTSDADSDQYLLGWFQYSDVDNYLLVFTHLKIKIFKNDTLVATVVTPYTGTQLENKEVNFSQSENSMVVVNGNIVPKELKRGGDDATWTFTTISFRNLPVYDFKKNYDNNTFKLSEIKVGTGHTLTCSSPIFDTTYVGGIFEGYGEDLSDELGRARITAYVSTTKVTVTIMSPFADGFKDPKTMKGSDVFLGEPAWGSARGYPKTVDYYEGRLFFGGSKSLPQTIFGSVADDKFNFDLGRALDSDSLQITLQKTNEIKYLVGDKTLQVFTTNDEYASLQLNGNPLTPTNLPFRKQSANGSGNISPVVLDNQTFYVQKGGKRVMNYLYDDNQNAYRSKDVSIIATHLIRNPVDSAAFKNDVDEDANYLLLINSDGTLAAYQTLIDEEVSAWTLSTTEGLFKRVTQVDNVVYYIVERTINSVTKQYVEKLDFDTYTDSTLKFTYGSPTTTITGLGHLEGEEVRVIGDGYNFGSFTVSSGEITLQRAVSTAAVGLEFNPLVETLPLDLQTNQGQIGYQEKRITRITVDYYNSLGVYVNDVLQIPFRTFLAAFDYPPSDPTTGTKRIYLSQGWRPRQTITITQKDPLPMTILAIGSEIG